MVRYFIRVNNGDNNTTVKYSFVHKDCDKLSKEEQDKAFDSAVKELERIYKSYGRFATTTGVIQLFSSFCFELSAK